MIRDNYQSILVRGLNTLAGQRSIRRRLFLALTAGYAATGL